MKKNKISLFVAIAFIIFVIALFTVKIIHKVDNTNENVSTNVVNTENDIENKTEEESMQNVIQDNSDNKVEENIVQEEKPTTNKTENDNKVVDKHGRNNNHYKLQQKFLHNYFASLSCLSLSEQRHLPCVLLSNLTFWCLFIKLSIKLNMPIKIPKVKKEPALEEKKAIWKSQSLTPKIIPLPKISLNAPIRVKAIVKPKSIKSPSAADAITPFLLAKLSALAKIMQFTTISGKYKPKDS